MVKSKTLWGSILGVVTLILASGTVLPADILPPWLVTGMASVSGFLVTFGMYDAAKQEAAGIVQSIQDFFKSQPFLGVVIAVVAQVADSIVGGGVPVAPTVLLVCKFLGGIIALMGLRGAVIVGRQNTDPPAAPK